MIVFCIIVSLMILSGGLIVLGHKQILSNKVTYVAIGVFLICIVGLFLLLFADTYTYDYCIEQSFKYEVMARNLEAYREAGPESYTKAIEELVHWNSTIIKYRQLRNNPWIGMFYNDFWDEIPYVRFYVTV